MPFYLLCTSHPWGISIVCIAGTMPSSALPVCMFCVDGTRTFTFLGPAFLVQSCACNVHPSCYVQLFLQYCYVGTYSIIWTHYTIFSHVTPAKWLFKASLLCCEHRVHLWREWKSWVIRSARARVDIVHQCPRVSGEIGMINTVCMKETKPNSYLPCKERSAPSTAVGSYISPNVYGLNPDKIKAPQKWLYLETRTHKRQIINTKGVS